MDSLRFNGSIWINVDVALRHIDRILSQAVKPLDLDVIGWYVLRALYQKEGQHATELANAVGRVPTSFTSILDNLEHSQLIERRRDPKDRRAVLIYLTPKGESLRKKVAAVAEQTDRQFHNPASDSEWEAFQRVLAKLVNPHREEKKVDQTQEEVRN